MAISNADRIRRLKGHYWEENSIYIDPKNDGPVTNFCLQFYHPRLTVYTSTLRSPLLHFHLPIQPLISTFVYSANNTTVCPKNLPLPPIYHEKTAVNISATLFTHYFLHL